jgi:hypothetical protein
MVVALSGGGGEDVIERRKEVVLQTPKKKVDSEPASRRGRNGTMSTSAVPSFPMTPRTPNAHSPSFRGVIPTSTRLQERRFKALAEQEGTPPKRVRWASDVDVGVGERDEGPKTPLSMRLQARMLREWEEEDASPSGRRGASDSGGMHPAAPTSGCRESFPKALPPPIPVAVVDAAEAQEDLDEESENENEPDSAAESGGGDDDDAESEAADADCASGATVDGGRAWLSGAKATRATGRALREIMGYGSDVSEEEGEGGDEKDGDLEEAEANASPSRIAPVIGERDGGVDPERRELQFLATTAIPPWDDVPGPLGVPIGLVSAAEAGLDLGQGNLDTQEDAREIDNQVVAPIPECDNPVQKRRSSARLAGIHSQRGSLPPPHLSTPVSVSRTRRASSTTRRNARGSASGKKIPKSDASVPISVSSTNQTSSTTTPSSTSKPGPPNFRIVGEPEEVRRARLAYPDPLKSSKSGWEARKGDWNARNTVDWETSLGKRVAVRMLEMGVGVGI